MQDFSLIYWMCACNGTAALSVFCSRRVSLLPGPLWEYESFLLCVCVCPCPPSPHVCRNVCTSCNHRRPLTNATFRMAPAVCHSQSRQWRSMEGEGREEEEDEEKGRRKRECVCGRGSLLPTIPAQTQTFEQ